MSLIVVLQGEYVSYISACSVKSHLVKDAGEVSNLVLKIALKVNGRSKIRLEIFCYLEVDPVVEELCSLFLSRCSFPQSVIPAFRVMDTI